MREMALEHLTDEHLVAYTDGELDEASARRVEIAMAADPDVARRVMAFQRSRRLVRAAFAAEPVEVPPALREAVEARIAAVEARTVPKAEGSVVPFRPRRPIGGGFSGLLRGAAAAAAVAAVAAGAGLYVGRGPSAETTAVAVLDRPETAEALSTRAAGDGVTIDGARVSLVQSYVLADGSLCREIAVEEASGATSALACRAAGRWEVRFSARQPAAVDGYAPASGATAIDGYLDAVGAGSPLDPVAEAAALAALR
ncbi:anti-sigma factor family protein [Oharaeibacter diazotrophicus]|uniref:Anti-sigma factor RsiW n=3 Tax=Oharaeibacter diazotrophicus TaxID=1920512 RepID=A0A4R6RFX3_9HYPH|nr:hypothetical protein [Oharaeibacter diazotrophicus]TDP85311.1 hypothetical protein EDD54_2163 [Oharaeibacter diazotrophicus]BBE74282.1 hypothetical protein OHA_1_03912 [Pleomorphomonas sp. SM30]GLS76028.1 anti-sigma factor [Oharaeibacter diazotrophicus]